jgi:3-oxoacyl-[acyl-carrier-protein] synthase III
MSNLGSAYISGSGSYLPELVVTNEYLSELLSIDAERIFKSSGIRERRWATPETKTSDLAGTALQLAIGDAQIASADIDYLLFGTMTPDRFIPGSASAVQHKLGLGEIPCLDIRAACCNALYALQLARTLIISGTAHNVAICLAEIQSCYLNLTGTAATTSMLFGDGAAAFIVSSEPFGMEIKDVFLASNGAYVDDLGIRSPGTELGTHHHHPVEQFADDYYPRMVGQSVILQASRRMVAACQTVLQRNKLSPIDVRWVVPHQANANLLQQVARGLELPESAEVISVLENTGNTSSASMGIALDVLRRSGKAKAGDYIMLPGFAAGFTWGAGLIRVHD